MVIIINNKGEDYTVTKTRGRKPQPDKDWIIDIQEQRIAQLESELWRAKECLSELIVGGYVDECGRAIIDLTGLLNE